MKTMVSVMQRRDGRAICWQVSCAGSCGAKAEHASHIVHRVFDMDGHSLFTCDCPAYSKGGQVCRHMKAAWRSEMAARGCKTVFSKTIQAAKTQHRPTIAVRSGAGKYIWATHRKVRKVTLPEVAK